MAGILVQLILSWLIVWYFNNENLSVLGLSLTAKRIRHFALFFTITASLCTSGFVLKMLIAKQQWQLNEQLHWKLITDGVWYTIKSVMFEELIFRGVIFYLIIRKLGPRNAILISAMAFGIYHWFSHNTFGNPQAMFIDFMVTGTMGLVLAYGYAKTWSLYIPIAIHLGWNLVQQVAFSNGPIGNQLFTEVMPRPIVTVSYFSFFFMQFFPLVSVLTINPLLIWKKQESLSRIKQKDNR